MRIFGGHDYYDSALAYGRDESITLVRYKERKIEDRGSALPSLLPPFVVQLKYKSGHRDLGRLEAHSVVVVFCNKIYRGVQFGGYGQFDESHWYWSGEKLRAALLKEDKDGDLTISIPLSKEKTTHFPWKRRKFRGQEEDTDKLIDAFFEPLSLTGDLERFMIENRFSIITRRSTGHWSWIPREDNFCLVNPDNLKGLEFAKAVDPYTAFQELSMWVGGVLGGISPEMVNITDDKVLIASHGFDKHSFRSSTRTD